MANKDEEMTGERKEVMIQKNAYLREPIKTMGFACEKITMDSQNESFHGEGCEVIINERNKITNKVIKPFFEGRVSEIHGNLKSVEK